MSRLYRTHRSVILRARRPPLGGDAAARTDVDPPANGPLPAGPPGGRSTAGAAAAARPAADGGRTAGPVRVAGGRYAWLTAAAQLTRRTLASAWRNRILGLSAEAAFWSVLSLPPILLALLAMLGYAGPWLGSDTLHALESQLVAVAQEFVSPAVVEDVVRPVVGQLLSDGRVDVATVSLVLALWAGSSATATFVNTITIAYGQRELRGAVASRLVALALYGCVLLVGAVAAPLLLIGPSALAAALPADWRHDGAVAIRLVYWPVTALVVFLALAAFYHYATPVRLRWRRAMPGAALAVLLFLFFSWALRLYVGAVFSRLLLFSTLAAPVLTLLYFYAIALAVLFGAELNAALEDRWPTGAHRSRLLGAWRVATRLPHGVRRVRPWVLRRRPGQSPVGSDS
jgi:membrane protein